MLRARLVRWMADTLGVSGRDLRAATKGAYTEYLDNYGSVGALTSGLQWMSTLRRTTDPHRLYKVNANVYAAVRRIAQDVAQVPFVIAEQAADGTFKPISPEAPPAAIFRRPNPGMTKQTFIESQQTLLELDGSVFIEVERLGESQPRELYLTPRRFVSVQRRLQSGLVDTWNVTAGARGVRSLKNGEELIRLSYVAPDLDEFGQSPLEAAQNHAALDEAAILHNAGFFHGGGRPPGVLEQTEDNDLTPAQVNDLKNQWQAQFAGPGDTKRVPVLPFGIKFTGYPLRSDGDFAELMSFSREQELSAAGVPPALVGVFQYANYANSEQQRFIYWMSSVWPRLSLVAELYTAHVLPLFNWRSPLVAYFDFDKTPAAQEIRITRASSLVSLVNGGIYTPNEARSELGKPPVVGGDTLRAPQTLAPIGPVAAGPGLRSESKARPARGKRVRARDKMNRAPEWEQRRAEAEKDFMDYVAPAQRQMVVDLRLQKDRVLASVSAALSKYGPRLVRAIEFDEVWSDEQELDAMRDMVARLAGRIVSERSAAALREVGDANTALLLDDPAVAAFLEEFAYQEGVLITGTTKDLLAQVITTWQHNNEGQASLISAIEDLFDLRFHEAERIARTEVLTAYNFATSEAWAKSDMVIGEQWLTAGDEAVRETHAEMDYVARAIDQPFILDGDDGPEEAWYPGDPTLSAGNRINCRCSTVPVLVGEEDMLTESVRRVAANRKALDAFLRGEKPLTRPGLNGHKVYS